MVDPLAYVQANLVVHCNVVEIAWHRAVAHFVYASSSSVCGGNTKRRAAELRMLLMQPGDVERTFADIDVIQAERGYAPTTPIEVGVPNFVRWYRDYVGS